jgi:tetratricopeptide (TPR) repeat protein
MRRVIRCAGIILSVLSAAVFTATFCGAESGTPPPEKEAMPPTVPRGLRTPRPITGGDYYYELAEVHKRYGMYDKAVEMLQTAIEKETDPARKTRFYESLGETYQMTGKPQEAAEQIRNAIAASETIEEKCRYNTVLGRVLEQAGHPDEAIKAYEFVVANASRDIEKRNAQLSLFRLYQSSGQLDNLIADLEKKLKENPADEEALNTLSQIYNSVVREPAKALPVYERLAKLRPQDSTILNRLVYLYQANKEYEKAAEIYQRMMEITPPSNKSYYDQHVSRMYMLAGKKDEAIQWAEKSLSEAGARPFTYVSVAQIFLQNNMVDEALKLYDRAQAACDRPIEKHQIALRFADLFSRNNREKKAEELYQYVLKEADVPSFKSQARSKLISLYRQQGRTDEAQELTQQEERERSTGP